MCEVGKQIARIRREGPRRWSKAREQHQSAPRERHRTIPHRSGNPDSESAGTDSQGRCWDSSDLKAQGDGRRLGNNINLHHAKGIERFLTAQETQIVNLQVRIAKAGAGIHPNATPAVQTRVRMRARSELHPGALVILRDLEILEVDRKST